MHTDVLAFWFEEIDPRLWFAADSDFDDLIRGRFLGLIDQAAVGELFPWRGTVAGRLAEIIVLDQFPRNAHRNTARAFAHDSIALVLAQEAVAAGALDLLEPTQRSFLLLDRKSVGERIEPQFSQCWHCAAAAPLPESLR